MAQPDGMSGSDEEINAKLAWLADHMDTMSENDMGWFNVAEAALFITACAAIRNLIAARETRAEDEEEAKGV